MTKLTEMIKVKDAVVGAGILTALSGFISQPAHALIFRLFSTPNQFRYDLSLDTENSASPVSELEVFDSGLSIFKDYDLSLNPPAVSTINRNEVATTFNVFNNNVELTATAQLFQYTIPINREITYNLDGFEQNITLNSVGFIVPNEVKLNGSNVTVHPTIPDLESLGFFDSRNINLPLTVNGMIPDGVSIFDIDNISSVPEPGMTIGLLSLLWLGLANTVRRKSMMKTK